jgi:hypothetical protein
VYWFDLATTHYAVVLLEGIIIGYVLKYALDALFSHFTSQRAQKVEDVESLMEEMFWQGASAQSRLDGADSNDDQPASIADNSKCRTFSAKSLR